MKNPLHNVWSCALVCLGLAAGLAQAQPGKRPLTDRDKAKVITKAPVDLDKAKVDAVKGGLWLGNVTVRRDADRIRLGGLVENVSFQAIPGVQMTISVWTATGWGVVKQESFGTMPARQQRNIAWDMSLSNSAFKFKVDVTAGSQRLSQEVQLAEKKIVHVLQYRCPTWTTYGSWSQDVLVRTKKEREKLNALGLETKTVTVRDEGVFDTDITVTMQYRQVNWQERTFGTAAEAQQFRNALPQRGMEFKNVER